MSFLSSLYMTSGGGKEAPEGSNAAEGSTRHWGRGPGRTRGGKIGGGGQGRTRRSRRERTPSPDLTAAAVAEEEEEEERRSGSKSGSRRSRDRRRRRWQQEIRGRCGCEDRRNCRSGRYLLRDAR